MLKTGLVALGLSVGSFGLALGQTVPQPVVIDSNGKVVGLILSENEIILAVKNNQGIIINVSPAGFIDQRSSLQYFHSSPDCAGARSLDAGYFPVQGYAILSTTPQIIVNAGPNTTVQMVVSVENFNNNTQSFDCENLSNPFADRVAPIIVTQISSLGLVPPFKFVLR